MKRALRVGVGDHCPTEGVEIAGDDCVATRDGRVSQT